MNTFQYFRNLNFPGSILYNPVRHLMTIGNKNGYKEGSINIDTNAMLQNGTMRIMLADDDIDDRELFTEAINDLSLNFSLELVEDGHALIQSLLKEEKQLPHIIFLDLNMPNRNGKECLDIIRKNERLKNIIVVIYSTSSSQKDIDETYEGGANLYVRKSSSFSGLLQTTRKVLYLNWDQYKPKSSRSNFLYSPKTS